MCPLLTSIAKDFPLAKEDLYDFEKCDRLAPFLESGNPPPSGALSLAKQWRRGGEDETEVALEPERYSQKMRQKRYDEVVLVAHHSIVY